MPSKKIMKAVGQAIKDWNMIEDGDRLLLGLSGGKDSLALLHILLAVQVKTLRFVYVVTPASFRVTLGRAEVFVVQVHLLTINYEY